MQSSLWHIESLTAVRLSCCPVLQFVLPTDSPHLAKSAFAMALSPVLWAQHKPDRFDSWSAGIVLLQLCLPPVRSPRGLNLFKTEYERAGYDLQEWRKGCRWISKRDTAVLDEDDGAGGCLTWDCCSWASEEGVWVRAVGLVKVCCSKARRGQTVL
jgi:hypothetical protein